MSFPAPLKSGIYLVISGLVLYIFGGIIPRILTLLDSGSEKIILTAIFWIGIFCIIGIPQYFAWFTDEELPIYAPIASIAILAGSIAGVAVLTLIQIRLFDTITLSSAGELFFFIAYWLAIMGLLFVPQYFVFKPLSEEGD